jgi:hypothetical protein
LNPAHTTDTGRDKMLIKSTLNFFAGIYRFCRNLRPYF